MKELTLRAAVIGLLLSVIMGAANVYLGLKAGMTVSASIPAAVIAMVILRKFFKGGTILESNQVQTAASAGESLAAGIIFTMPALILIGAWTEFDWMTTTVVAFTGGLLGILFMIPMRRVFVIKDSTELKYPEGLACAEVLKAGEEGASDNAAKSIFVGAGIGALFKVFASFIPLFKHSLEGAGWLAGRVFYFGGDVSPALVAVGYIVGLNVAVLIFIGGAIGWLVQIPLLSTEGLTDGSALDAAWTLWSTKVRYTGVGAMVVGGVASIWKVRHGLVEAVREIRGASIPDASHARDKNRDIPAGAILLFSAIAVALVAAIYFQLTQSAVIAGVTTVIMVIMSFFFTAVASYIVGLVGNSNSPVSGMTITAVLFTGMMLVLFGFTGMEGMVATLGVAAIVCCAACTSGDVCNDLKTGQLVGASPFRQQIMQIAGVFVAALVMAPVLQLLHDHTPGGIGGRELAAPQAALFANLAKGFFGEGHLPWDLVGVGVVIGLVVLLVDLFLDKSKSPFRAHLMPIAVGIYLPFGLATPIFLGGLIAWYFNRGKEEAGAGPGILFSSGIIAGESLMGVGIALLAAAGIERFALDVSEALSSGLTVAAAIFLIIAFVKMAQQRSRS